MILSVSRRTDIPACYSEWFINRLHQGYVLTRNPMNYHQVSRIDLSTDLVECIVFWTKNSIPFMDCLDELDRMGYLYMFQYTITPYDNTIEKNIPNKKDIIKNALELSNKIGSNRIVWRYDPILINDTYTVNRHIELFESMCARLHTAVNHVIISFVDLYHKNGRQELRCLSIGEINYIAQEFGKIGGKYGLTIKTCCESYKLDDFGIEKGACIDADLLQQLCGRSLRLKKSVGQRKGCLCRESVDIGIYNTCANGCVYCYANDYSRLENKRRKFDKDGEILCDKIDYEKDIIKIRNMKKL